MKILLWAEVHKLRRSRILWVLAFGIAMVLLIVAAQGQFAGNDDQYGLEPEWFLTGVQSLGTFYALPGLIALLGSYIICREKQDDTLKSLLIIPVEEGKMLLAKMIMTFFCSVGVYLLLFFCAWGLEFYLHSQVLTLQLFARYCKMYLLDGVGVFLAVTPIICITARIGQGHWIALVIAEIYSFSALLIGGGGTIAFFHPIVSVFGFSGYYSTSALEYTISMIVLCLCAGISALFLFLPVSLMGTDKEL